MADNLSQKSGKSNEKTKYSNAINRTTSETMRLGEPEKVVNHPTSLISSTPTQRKKTPSFQITSVTVGSRTSNDGGDDSADDLDESHTDDMSDVIDNSRITDIENETPSYSEDTFSKEDVFFNASTTSLGTAPVIPTSSQYGLAIVASEGGSNIINAAVACANTISGGDVHVSVTDAGNVINIVGSVKPHETEMRDGHAHHAGRNERFKVVKIESTEPFKRGRWLCMDYLDHTMQQPSQQAVINVVRSNDSSDATTVGSVQYVGPPDSGVVLTDGPLTLQSMDEQIITVDPSQLKTTTVPMQDQHPVMVAQHQVNMAGLATGQSAAGPTNFPSVSPGQSLQTVQQHVSSQPQPHQGLPQTSIPQNMQQVVNQQQLQQQSQANQQNLQGLPQHAQSMSQVTIPQTMTAGAPPQAQTVAQHQSLPPQQIQQVMAAANLQQQQMQQQMSQQIPQQAYVPQQTAQQAQSQQQQHLAAQPGQSQGQYYNIPSSTQAPISQAQASMQMQPQTSISAQTQTIQTSTPSQPHVPLPHHQIQQGGVPQASQQQHNIQQLQQQQYAQQMQTQPQQAVSQQAQSIPQSAIPQQSMQQPQGMPQQPMQQPQGISQQAMQQPQGMSQQAMQQPQGMSQQAMQQSQGMSQQAMQQPQGMSQQAMQQPQGMSQQAMQQSQGISQQAIQQSQGMSQQAMPQQAMQQPQGMSQQAMQQPQGMSQHSMQQTQGMSQQAMQPPQGISQQSMQQPQVMPPQSMQQPVQQQALPQQTLQQQQAMAQPGMPQQALQQTQTIPQGMQQQTIQQGMPQQTMQQPQTIPQQALQQPQVIPQQSLQQPQTMPQQSLQQPQTIPQQPLQQAQSMPQQALQAQAMTQQGMSQSAMQQPQAVSQPQPPMTQTLPQVMPQPQQAIPQVIQQSQQPIAQVMQQSQQPIIQQPQAMQPQPVLQTMQPPMHHSTNLQNIQPQQQQTQQPQIHVGTVTNVAQPPQNIQQASIGQAMIPGHQMTVTGGQQGPQMVPVSSQMAPVSSVVHIPVSQATTVSSRTVQSGTVSVGLEGTLPVDQINSSDASVALLESLVEVTANADEVQPSGVPAGEDAESASGTSAVAIDNKIEQAMDLVKSHLMFAVREEVEVLKEKIAELMDRINQLELENTILKAHATQETLAQLGGNSAQQGNKNQQTQPPPNSSVS